MTRSMTLGSLALLAACTGTTTTPPEGPFNFDVEIDGGGQDYNNPDPEWTPDLDESFGPKMCVADNGTIYVVWQLVPYADEGGRLVQAGFSDVFFNRSRDGGATWLPSPIRVKQGPGDASGVDMACNGDRVYVVWEDTRDGETGYQNIYLNYSTDGGDTWENDDKAIDNDPEGFAISLGPKVLLDEGRVHVVWYDQVEGAPDVYMATSINAGRKFEAPVRVSGNRDEEDPDAGTSWNGNPQMAISGGRIYVVWETTKNGRQDIFGSVSGNNGQSFNPQKRIDTGDERGSNYSFAPRLAADGQNAYVVWHDSRSGARRDVYMNYTSDGGSNWLDAAVRVESLTGEGFTESIFPDVVAEGDAAHIVWQDAAQDAGYDIYYRKATAGSFGETAEVRVDTDDQGAGNSAHPHLALDGGQIAVIWQDYRNDAGAGYDDLTYNYFDPAAEEPAWLEEDLALKSVDPGTSFSEGQQSILRDGVLYSVWVDGRNGSRDVFFSQVALGDAVESLAIYEQLAAAAQGQ